MKIAVLLSTFNGEKYLKEQIESILSQSHKDLILYIRDDGSSDDTKIILDNYASKDRRITIDYGRNIGYTRSFFEMLKVVEADAYAFCDQDDLWMSDKLERANRILEKTRVPTLWFSNANICDENMKYVSKGNRDHLLSFSNSLFMNVTQGMTMVINNYARKQIIKALPINIMYHDWWFYKVCSAFGDIVFDEQVLVNYRRHGNNASELSYNKRLKIKNMIFRLLKSDMYARTKTENDQFRELFYDELSEQNKEIILLFTDYSLGNRLKKFFYPERLKKTFLDELVLRIFLLVGII